MTSKWKMQFWKGKYGKINELCGISSGCEIGLYYKSGWQWKCACQKNRMLRMSFTLYCKAFGKNQKLFSRDSSNSTSSGKAWWLTAFKPAIYMPLGIATGPGQLKMKGTIYFDSNNEKYRTQMQTLSTKLLNSANSKFKVGGSTWKRTFVWNY